MVRKKKEPIRPVVAKPLSDTEKRNLVTSFVTSNVNEVVNNDVTKNDTNNVTDSVTNIVTEIITDNVTKNDTDKVTDKGTLNVTDNVTESNTIKVTDIETKKVTKEDTKSVTKKVTKDVTIIKSISIGKKEIIAKFTTDKRLRPNYNLSEDTVEKIEKVSDILGYKKADFLDIYLNGTLTKVLKDLEKNNK